MIDYSNKNTLLIVSILAAVLGCIADILLLYSPNGNYHLGDYQFFHDISKTRIIWGYYIGILFIAFELLGFWVVAKAIYPKNNSHRQTFFAILCFLFLLGIVYHAAVSYVGVIMTGVENGAEIIQDYQTMSRPLEILMAIFLIIPTFLIISRILKGKTLFPKWIVFFNPALIYLIITIIYFLIPFIGNVLMVAGFNLSNGIFLMACTYVLWNKKLV